MVQYYYEKYNSLITSYNYNVVWSSASESSYSVGGTGKSLSYYYDSAGNPRISGELSNSDIVVGAIFYYVAGTSLYKAIVTQIDGPGIPTAFYWRNDGVCRTPNKTPVYGRGSLVQSNISAEDGTYPANGRHMDGFWYVKGGLAGPLPPGMVYNGPFSTHLVSGRKFIRLQDGTFVAAVYSRDSNLIRILISKDNGVNWTQALFFGSGIGLDVAITPITANTVGIVYVYTTNIKYRTLTRNGDTFTAGTEINLEPTTLSSPSNVSIDVDPATGDLYASWSGYKAPYQTSSNIFRTVSTDKGVTWSAASFITTSNESVAHNTVPTVIVRNNQPIYLYRFQQNLTNTSIMASIMENGSLVHKTIFTSTTTNAMDSISGVVDKDDVIHVSWGRGDSYYYVWYSKSIDGGKTWTTPIKLTNAGNTPSITVDKNNTVKIVAYPPTGGGLIVYTLKNGIWTDYKTPDEVARYPQTLVDKTFRLSFGDVPPTIYMKDSATVYYKGSFSNNIEPSITITSPENNQTLYENDTINISGDAYDADKDQSVTVFYQINGEQRKVLATNVSQKQITLSKQLIFKDGKLYDGETVLTETLAEGVEHKIKVWAVDSENEQSATVERTFYVVPNRAPLLSIDAVVPSGIINTDKFKISGITSDQDANSTVTVNYRINGANPVEIYTGTGGAWEFEILLNQLKVGENLVVVEVVDNYNAKTSKTIKLNKNEVKTPILQSVARYKIEPPKGSAKGVLLWIQRDEDLELNVELSMTLKGEQEQYIQLEADPDKVVPVVEGIVEDEYYHETVEPKDNIILKLTTTRANTNIDNKIYLIMGVVE